MLVSYTIKSKEELPGLVKRILARHFFGTVLLELETPFGLGDSTTIRDLVFTHPCWLKTEGASEPVLKSWFDAGIRKIALPANDQGSETTQLDSKRLMFEEISQVSQLGDAVDKARTGKLFSIDSSNNPSWLGDLLFQSLRCDRPDGLIPTVVADEFGVALGLVYSNRASIQASLESGKGVYWSRSRNELWEKGKTSGATQSLVRIDPDCDRDALRFTVKQVGSGFCHLERRNCFCDSESDLGSVFRHLKSKIDQAEPNSYTRRLVADDVLRHAKLREEAAELCGASNVAEITWESADLFYFSLANAIANDVDLSDIVGELIRRTQKVTRRPGNAKSQYIEERKADDE